MTPAQYSDYNIKLGPSWIPDLAMAIGDSAATGIESRIKEMNNLKDMEALIAIIVLGASRA